MIDEKKIELMKKLQRLAERGVGGEKEGAQKRITSVKSISRKKTMVFQRTGGGIACFAILRMVERLQTGLKKRTEKEQKTTRLLLC